MKFLHGMRNDTEGNGTKIRSDIEDFLNSCQADADADLRSKRSVGDNGGLVGNAGDWLGATIPKVQASCSGNDRDDDDNNSKR